VNIFTASGGLPQEKQKYYSQAKYNSGFVIAREIYWPFTPCLRARRVEMVQILHRQDFLLQLLVEPDNRRRKFC
jgi:exodeoxyribonuclease-3